MGNIKKETVQKIRDIVAEYFKSTKKDEYTMPLMSRPYDENEIAEVVDSLLTPEKLTLNAKGPLKIEKFESGWAKYIGVKNGIMVNSGTSANLLAFQLLTNPSIKRPLRAGDEVIVPAVNWAATVTPLYATGLVPVFVDVKDFCIDPKEIKNSITPKTKAILVVHLLGFAANMTEIIKIAKEHNLYVVEDCCEAHGAEHQGKKVGSFGDIGTFSFYLSHHITTVEGGMVMTNNDEFAELARILRSQGIMRNVKDLSYKKSIERQYSDIDPRFLFVNTGYNYRPTEMEGAFGIVQLPKFYKALAQRKAIARSFNKIFSKYEHFILPPKAGAWFAYPILIKEGLFPKKQFMDFLEKNGIETRPILSGNYINHPVAKLFPNRVGGKLVNTEYIDKHGFLIGIHGGITKRNIEKLDTIVGQFISIFARKGKSKD